MTKEDINRDFEAMEKYADMVEIVIDTSEHMFMSMISATVDLYAIKHDKDRFDMMREMMENMKRCPL